MLTIYAPIMSTSAPMGSYNYAQDNKYTVLYAYTAINKNQLTTFTEVAHNKRYAHTGLRFRALLINGATRATAQQMYGINNDDTVLILREGRPHEGAQFVGTFSRDQLVNFIEQWLGDYLDALLAARKESKRAATALAYASYPPYWGYPYYGAYGWGYPYGYGYGYGYGMGIWF